MAERHSEFHRANGVRYRGGAGGHYESYFMRANHPERPLAFWIRYTIFAPKGRPDDAIGELWAIWFDGETHRHVAVKTERPMGECSFDPAKLAARIGSATLDEAGLVGESSANGHALAWDLAYDGAQTPLLLLPEALYDKKLPKAKALVGLPMATYRGTITVDGQTHAIDGWIGSQNHNWGSKHTDYYAWGQVAGFDDAPDTFLEVATGKLKFGPIWTPFMTPLALRHAGQEYRLGSIRQAFKADAGFTLFDWHFATEDERVAVAGRIRVDAQDVVGLRYYNPPGGTKSCLNSKVAACELRVTPKTGSQAGQETVLHSGHRAAFEILTDAPDHGIDIRV